MKLKFETKTLSQKLKGQGYKKGFRGGDNKSTEEIKWTKLRKTGTRKVDGERDRESEKEG